MPTKKTSPEKPPAKPAKKRISAKKTKPKDLRSHLRQMIEQPSALPGDLEAAALLGLESGQATNGQLVAMALLNKAKSGDVAAIKELRSLLGEAETENLGYWETLVMELKNGE